MSEEVKKISFGFSKLTKPKTSIISSDKIVKSDESVQYIDCVEDKSIKVKNEGPKKPDFLVIPLPKQNVSSNKRSELLQKILNNTDESENNDDHPETKPSSNVSTVAVSNKVESLDEIAAREIIEDLKNRKNTEDDKQDFTVPLTSENQLGSKEATLDDYESIPVEKFGFAMLRGMGWAPGKGVGKTEQVISAKQPILRPKGLGLGADKVIKADAKGITPNEQLKLVKGSFVRIIAGMHKDFFGEVIGFDDETGRLIVKMTLGNNILTFNEFMVQVISKEDFNKNSKVINVKKYEEYKLKENSQGIISAEIKNKQISDGDDRLNEKVKHKSSRRSSSVSSVGSSKDNKLIKKKTQRLSPERHTKEYSSKIKEIFRSKNSSRSPERYKRFQEAGKKTRTRSGSPEERNSNKYHSQSYYKESKSKKYRSSSEESFKSKHVSRKESKKRHNSSSSGESSEREKESKHRTRKSTSSSDSSSNEDRKKKHVSRSDYKKKCKKNKEKKSRKRSRSNSREKRRKLKSSKKHKKNKYYDS